MPQITALFWDVGGVLLSNGWDRYARQRATLRFQLDHDDFEQRHQARVQDFEAGRLSLDAYLGATVFYRERAFSSSDFRDFMYAQSQAYDDVLALAKSLHATKRYFMATLNNESLDLNDYRVQHFGLRPLFSLFVSSGYVGLTKPGLAIYQLALQLTQIDPGNVLLIDDREGNLEPARQLGMQTLHHDGDAKTLRAALARMGVTAG